MHFLTWRQPIWAFQMKGGLRLLFLTFPGGDALYDFNATNNRIGTGSIKWDRYKGKFSTTENLIPLWIADTDFKVPESVVDALHRRTDHGIFGYSFATDEYKRIVVDWFKKRHSLSVKEEWVCPTYGVVTALYFTILAMTEPDDKILVLTPIYDPFFAIIQKTGRELVECSLEHTDNAYQIDFEKLEDAFKGGVRMMIFCNPHNPIGRVWSREELIAVASLCKKYGVFLASDEIHCDLALFGNKFVSLLDLESSHQFSAVYTAASKTFNIAGLSASNMLIPDADVRKSITGKLMGAWILSPNIFGMEATKAAYQNGEKWLDEELAYLEGNSEFVTAFIVREMPQVIATRHEGTFLMWLDFRCLGLGGEELGRRLVSQCHVGIGDGFHYGKEGDGFIRLNIGCARKQLEQALISILGLYTSIIGGR